MCELLCCAGRLYKIYAKPYFEVHKILRIGYEGVCTHI